MIAIRIDGGPPPPRPRPEQVQSVDLRRLKAMKHAADMAGNRDGVTTREEFTAFASREQRISTTADVSLWRPDYSREIAFTQQNESRLFELGTTPGQLTQSFRSVFLNDAKLTELAKNDGNERDMSRRDLNGPIVAGLPPLPEPTPVPPPLPTRNSVAVNDLETFRRNADTNRDGRLSEAEFNSAANEIDDRDRWNSIAQRGDVITGRAFRFYGNNDANVVAFIRTNHDAMFDPSYRYVGSPEELISSAEVARRANLNGNGAELTSVEANQSNILIDPPLPGVIRSIETDRLSRLITQADTNGDRAMFRSEFNAVVNNMRAQDERLALNSGGRQAPVRYYDRQAIQFIQQNADQIFQAIAMTASFPGSTLYSSLSQKRLQQIANSLGDPTNVTRQEIRGERSRYYLEG